MAAKIDRIMSKREVRRLEREEVREDIFLFVGWMIWFWFWVLFWDELNWWVMDVYVDGGVWG